jgi:hypothetical protein
MADGKLAHSNFEEFRLAKKDRGADSYVRITELRAPVNRVALYVTENWIHNNYIGFNKVTGKEYNT